MARKLLPALALCCGIVGAMAFMQHSRPTEAPSPPQQNAPWAHGDDALSKATATLFEQGLADPRGLEYREVEIPIGGPWNGGGKPLKTHGWILPAQGQGQRFAIAWNGLAYPVARLGPPANVRDDWQGTGAGRAQDAARLGGFEASSVQFGAPQPLKAVLLLRLGEGELARRLWKSQPQDAADPYLSLARDWTWNAFERAVAAHMRGDDRLALADARLLARARPAIEAEAARRGIEPDRDFSNTRFPDRRLPLLPFLIQLPILLADCERRVANPGPASQGQGIAILIDDLQNVDARQWGQPGGVSLGEDPRVQALVKRGSEAVEPLLQALESDTRLTRSVSFGRDFHRSRHLIPVSEAAHAALVDLLHVRFKTYGENGEPLSSKEVAAQIRAYWAKMGSLSPAERFYTTLKDDGAGEGQWMQAAANIVQPADVERQGDWITIPSRKPGQKIVLRGEGLRDGRSPSVSQLLARRSDELDAIRTGSTRDHFTYQNAGQLALDLAAWDKAAAIPVLKKRLARAWSIGSQPNDILASNGSFVEHFGTIIVKMTLARVSCGDAPALDEYASWMQKADLSRGFFGTSELLKPLIQGAARPSIRRALDYLFNDSRSAWSNVLARHNGLWLPAFWQTPLASTSAFRKQALRLLADRSPSGSITFHPRADRNGQLEAEIRMGGMGAGSRAEGDPDTPPPGEKRPFRVCDACAYLYSQFRHGPKFQLFWPQAKRDAGVLACRKWLEAK